MRELWAATRQALPIPLRALPGSKERAEPEAPRGQTKVLNFEVDCSNGLTLSASNNTLLPDALMSRIQPKCFRFASRCPGDVGIHNQTAIS